MKMTDDALSPSGKLDSQANGFFSVFFSERQNKSSYHNAIQLYPAKAEIIKQDTPADNVYLIEHGLVKLVRETPTGSKMIVGLRHRDWLIGAPTVVLNMPYNFTAIAVVPTLLRSIPSNDFLEHVKKDEQFSWHVHQLLSHQIFDQLKTIEAMRCQSAETRLMRLLADTVRKMEPPGSGMPDRFALPLTNGELAQLLVITPEHLCRVLKKLEQKGLITRDDASVIVTEPAGLAQEVA